MFDFLHGLWLQIAGGLTILLALIASGHAVLHKRDVSAAAGWVAVIWLTPVAGPILYLLLGINRIRRRAGELRRQTLHLRATTMEMQSRHVGLVSALPEESSHLDALARLVDRVTRTPLAVGNAVEPLVNGDEAYPSMLRAIDNAERTIALGTYIFDNDVSGRSFADALGRAVERGVEVRVLIDSVGARYSWPPIMKLLMRQQVPVARFLHSVWPWRMPYVNLRNHRKFLIVDGRIGYTGGMNIRAGHVMAAKTRSPIQDVHFRIAGPVVTHLMHVFAEDWLFTTRELLTGEAWFPTIGPEGPVVARGIPDGPDHDFDKLRWAILGALARARHRVRIVTPYFLPDTTLVTSLNLAALRGVAVDVVLPDKNNLPYVKWACQAQLWQILSRDCRVFYSPPPFDHTKLLVVDGAWALIGSANWDPRSLRLNFEFNVELYDAVLGGRLDAIVDEKIAAAREITLADVDGRPFPVKLRDGVARLFSPYL